MKDFLGRELAVGDHVIMIVPNYRSLALGQIVQFTPKNVRVSWRTENTILQDASQLVKVEGPEVTLYLLKQKH